MGLEVLLLALVGAVASFLQKLFARSSIRLFGIEIEHGADKAQTAETPEARMQRLTGALAEAVQLVAEIEREIESRHQLAQKLQKDVEHANRLLQIKQPEVEAITQALVTEVRSGESRSFWKGVLVNFVFFIAGGGLTLLIG